MQQMVFSVRVEPSGTIWESQMGLLGEAGRRLSSEPHMRRAIGAKIALFGLFAGIVGALLIVYVSEPVGKMVFFLGFTGVFVGVFVSLGILVSQKDVSNSDG